jgi:hypothetical protein
MTFAVNKGNNNVGYVIGGVFISPTNALNYDATPAFGTGATSVWVPSTSLGATGDRHQLVCETFPAFGSGQTQYISAWIFSNATGLQVGGNTFIEVQRMS